HTIAGFQMKKRFASKGKRSIYNPGFATSIGCFFPIFVGFIICFITERAPTLVEVILATIFTLVMSIICINIAEGIFKNKHSQYPYDWGKGYFAKFEKK
ncbi:MAG: hypothetical protein ACRCW2_06065, partial [Cellulosilyticaceae bacterium]